MIQTIAAVLLAIHGIIHLIGFVTPWRIATLQGFIYKTTALNGALEVGDSGARLIGLVWLALAVGFVGDWLRHLARGAVGARADRRSRRGLTGRLRPGAAGGLRRYRH